MHSLPEGVFLVDKPVGISSFDIIRRIRTARGDKKLKLGYAGTLDPLASGLMILAEGRATKLLTHFLTLPKTYEAEICIGESSITGDADGTVTNKVEVQTIDERDIQNALASMVGVLELPVPIYSAIKRNGEALYKKARRGEQVETPIRSMSIHATKFVSCAYRNGSCLVRVQFDVGSGTYIRSLAEELGRRLGYPARLENLRRTKIDKWRVEDATHI